MLLLVQDWFEKRIVSLKQHRIGTFENENESESENENENEVLILLTNTAVIRKLFDDFKWQQRTNRRLVLQFKLLIERRKR